MARAGACAFELLPYLFFGRCLASKIEILDIQLGIRKKGQDIGVRVENERMQSKPKEESSHRKKARAVPRYSVYVLVACVKKRPELLRSACYFVLWCD